MTLSLNKRRRFLERAEFVHKLNQIGENNRAASVALNMRNEAERIHAHTRPVAAMTGVSAVGRAEARDHDAEFARELAERLAPGTPMGMTPYPSAPQTPNLRPFGPQPTPRSQPMGPPMAPPMAPPRAKAKAKAHSRSDEARLRDNENKRLKRATDAEFRKREAERKRLAYRAKKSSK